MENVRRDEGDARFWFRVPRGEIHVSSFSPAYTRGNARVTASVENQEVTLDVRPAASALVQLRDGETSIPWPGFDADVLPLFETEEPERVLGSYGPRAGGVWFTLKQPGTYQVLIPAIAGFEAHAPVEFEAIEGVQADVIVQLARDY